MKCLRKVMHIVFQQGTLTAILLYAPQTAKNMPQQTKGKILKTTPHKMLHTVNNIRR